MTHFNDEHLLENIVGQPFRRVYFPFINFINLVLNFMWVKGELSDSDQRQLTFELNSQTNTPLLSGLKNVLTHITEATNLG